MAEEQELAAAGEEGSGGAASPPRRQGESPRQQIRKAKAVTRRKFSAEEKIRMVMEGIRGELPISELCRREGLQTTVYYRWLKDFMEAGKQRLRGDILREARSEEVKELRAENDRLKLLVAEYALQVMAFKKSLTGA